MDLREYYGMPEGANATMETLPTFFDIYGYDFPCPKNMKNAFIISTFSSLGKLETAMVTNMEGLFKGNYNIKAIDASEWDVSNVVYINDVFSGCTNLTELNVTGWDLQNIKELKNFVAGCQNLNEIKGHENIKTSNILKSLSGTFDGCRKLTKIDISTWDTSSVTDIGYFANNCVALLTIGLIDCSSVTSVSRFFGSYEASSLTNLGGFKNLKINWTDNYGLVKAPNLTHESVMNVVTNLYDFRGNGDSSTTRTLKLNSKSLGLLSADEIAIATSKGWTLTA